MEKIYNVFISHSWQHVADLINLRNLLEQRKYFKINFFEVPPHDPINSSNNDYIKSRIRNLIKKSDIVIGLAGMYANYSDWMEWELETAKQEEIPIIGVIPRGQIRISQTVCSKSKNDIHWNTESIVDAIRKYSK